jgi:O-antigen ligase
MIFNKSTTFQNIDLFFLSILLLSLPIAHVTSIQNIALWGFILVGISKFDKKTLVQFFTFKVFLISYLFLLILAIISIKYSIQPKESISEIRSEIIQPFVVLLFTYFYTMKIDHKRTIYFFTLICIALFFHTILNLLVWIYNGGWPARTGGFLDGTIGTTIRAGERFGIYATYALSMSIALFFTKYKKFAFIFLVLSLISIVANNTRATFIGMLFIFISYFIFIYKNKLIKFSLLTIIVLSIISFIFYSKNLHTRFNAYNLLSKTEYLVKYSPSEYDKLIKEHNMGFSAVSRLAMWKSALLYRIQDPLIPLGYGRFLYKKELKQVWKNEPQNIPFVIFSQLHSDFMSMFFSLGIIGLLAFITILVYFFKASHYIYKHNIQYRFIGIFFFLGLSGHIASMLFGSFFGDSEEIYFYILYAFALALYLKTKENNNEETHIYQSK